MVDLLHPDAGAREPRSPLPNTPGVLDAYPTAELHQLAYDLVGRPELDELSPDEQLRLAHEIDGVIARMRAERRIAGRSAPASAASRLAELLSPRVEALPLHLRVTLANARRRQLLGID
jgi:hypothetical protein